MTFPPEAADKLLAAAAESGVASADLFAAAGAPATGALDYGELCALYEAAAHLTGDPDFGLRVGSRTRPDDYGMLGYAAAHSGTLGEAFEALVALQGVWTDAVGLELRNEGSMARLRYLTPKAVAPAQRRHECEQMMAAIAGFAAAATGGGARLAEVRFEHRAPEMVDEHRRVFACPVVFRAAATELAWPAEMLALELVASDSRLGALIRAHAETALLGRNREEPLLRAVRRAVREALGQGRAPALAAAAAAVGLGPRTLQRRLRAQGVGWRALVEAVRIDLAKDLLADPRRGISQIAFLAGFSQASAFHRAFRRIAGTTPRRYRLGIGASEERR